MSGLPVHSKMLTEAGRRLLRPMGLTQKGRSRIWLDDRMWWAIVVEFQPSSFLKGSYLNVGCVWLWNAKDYISFDVGGRIAGLRPFESEDTFRITANDLAQRAIEEITMYRSLFPDVEAVTKYFSSRPPAEGWPMFNAAVAFGLAGKPDRARELFKCVRVPQDSADWVRRLEADAKVLRELVGDTQRFRSAMVERVRQTRSLQKLTEARTINFGEAEVF